MLLGLLHSHCLISNTIAERGVGAMCQDGLASRAGMTFGSMLSVCHF